MVEPERHKLHSGTVMPLPFEEADRLLDEICAFLEECGGPYRGNISGELQDNILWAIASGQYVYSPDRYFASWWRIRQEDIEGIKDTGIRPKDFTTGPILWVTELASKGCMWEVIKAVRGRNKGFKGLYFNRWKDSGVIHHYPHQGGGKNGGKE